MKINPSTAKVTSSHSTPGAPENIRTEIEETRDNLGDTAAAITLPRPRLSSALSTMKTKTAHVRASAPQRARQAQHAVRRRPVPAAATALTAVGAVAAVLIRRRRAAKARAARNRWLPGFLHR
ncbi:hypothetical protein AB0M36_35310 [Actinoplanes sp. NPDC051346]|uniref:hypothetical protein n=1 Tax=Actinoplanes sp. NPDC051346 TaxID=3155048 RepID=UPI0034149098